MRELFDEEEINRLPVFYRYMVEFKKENVKELRTDSKFSESKSHQTDQYLVKDSIKSLLDLR